MSAGAPTWVDSHCHLDFADFQEEGVAAFVDRARLNRVGHMLTISTHTQRLPSYVQIAENFPNIWTTIGVHPHQANEEIERDITAEKLIVLANGHERVVGIGEAGLDYHYDFAPRDQQHKVFQAHIDAAVETGLPLIIHAREADDDMIAILKNVPDGKLKAIMHCFSSTRKLADFALGKGLYLSFSGIVTFPKALELQDICKNTPVDRIWSKPTRRIWHPCRIAAKEMSRRSCRILDVSWQIFIIKTKAKWRRSPAAISSPCFQRSKSK